MADLGRSPSGRAGRPTDQAPAGLGDTATIPNADETLLYALDSWAFNVMLECDGREEPKIEVVIGGAILDLRDLQGVLEWARQQAQGIEAQRAETTQIGSVADESPVPQGCAQTQSSTPDNKDKPNA